MKLIFYIISFIFQKTKIKKYIFHNLKYFTPNNNKPKKILVEFNNWQPLHISFSYLSNYLAKLFDASIVSYPGYTLISENLERSGLFKPISQ